MSLLIAAAAMLAGPNCVDALCNADALAPYFRKLAEARGRGGAPVHILQIGDSHTAGDALTGGWRDLLQARYGSGGRGVLAAGRPYAGYLTRGVTASMSDGWSIAATFGAGSSYPRPPIGVSGFSVTSQRSGARLSLTADTAQMFDRFTICAMTGPNAGALSIRVGTQAVRFDLDSFTARPECRTVKTDAPQSIVDVVTEGGPVTVTSWATFHDGGGVVLSNVGVVGSQLVHFSRTSDSVIAEEMRAYRPDLIVLAFGTNEGFAPRFNPQEFEITLRTQIGRLRRLAAGVPILLLGAPDASTRRPELRANAPGPTPAYCPANGISGPNGASSAAATPRALPPIAPGQTQAAAVMPTGLADIIARVRADENPSADAADPAAQTIAVAAPVAPPAYSPPAASDAGRAPLFPPAGLASVRGVQARVAASLNLAFWDWSARMGGPCSAPGWVRGNPPLMRGDYVHFNSAGGREIAGRLQADLERAAAARGGTR
jgi:lysophospholipase L1-like esterase